MVLAGLNLIAIGLGLGAGGLSATIVGLLLGAGLDLAGVEAGPDIGLVVGVACGLLVGGWWPGRCPGIPAVSMGRWLVCCWRR